MRLRQAKKRLWWSKGEGDYISNHRSKNHHENYKKKYLKLRPEYYDEKRGGWVYPSCADIDIVRRANVRLGRWIRKGKKLKEQLKKDMKELIKEAENIRAKLLEVMLNIPYDFEPDYTIAITQAADFLKKLIDRKDYIVDLGEVWHTLDLNASVPDSNIAYLDIIAIVDNKIVRRVNCLASLYRWLRTNAVVQGQVKWAYLKDLLPKGDNK